MRSMIRSYSFDQSRRTPPTLTNSATTSPTPRSLMLSMREAGKVFSRPTRMPTFFTVRLSFQKQSGILQPGQNLRVIPSRLQAPRFLCVYENSELYILARGLVNADGGHPRKGFWHQ